ncbi:hypothetical protein RJ640_011502 [Escallonia rubra]|uniref:P-type ATPase A domain-containing protein n=1 Tax=Escallonia rubra TaxID=112253 RepID=A0AA88RNA0_9ASTE|nr:hypothetical protein RJ640_011502 [Escallonia rubra]
MVIKPTKSCHKWWRVAFTAVRFSRELLALLITAKKRRNHKRWRLAFAGICCTRFWVSLTKRTSPHQRWRMAFATIYSSRILISLLEEVAAKNNENALHDVPPISIVVDSSRESSSLFKVDQESLAALVKDKNLDHLRRLGGVEGILSDLNSDAQAGIHGDVEDLRHRFQIYGSNTYKTFRVSCFQVSEIYKSFTIYIILFVAAYLFWYGIHYYGLRDGWKIGGYVTISSFVSCIFLFLTNFGVQNFFDKSLNKVEKATRGHGHLVDVVRNGMEKQISETQIVVGDIVHLETGDQVPADGLFLSGQSLKVNESSLGDPSQNFVNCNLNPFLFSRTNVIDGSARMLVTAVGMNTRWGDEKSSTNHNKKTPLQARVHNPETFARRKVCFTAASLVLVVSLARLFSGNTKHDDGAIEFIGGKTSVADTFYITGIIAVTHVMAEAMDLDSLSWVVMICLAHSIKRMMGGKVFIPEPLACETMASVSSIVTDKAAASMLKGSRQFEECLKAGVNFKTVTEEDISAATTIATECGILQPNQDTKHRSSNNWRGIPKLHT